MKKALLIASLLFFGLQFTNAQTLSKEEKKRIKTELKNYKKHPDQYLAMQKKYKDAIAERDATIEDLQSQLAAALAAKGEAEAKADVLEKELADLQAKMTELQEQAQANAKKAAGGFNEPAQGVFYRVQIGLYKGLDLSKYFVTTKALGIDRVNDLNAYVVSYFEGEDEAQEFAKDLRKFGIRDAFVAKYENGQRIYDWASNPKFKGKKLPATLEEGIQAK